MQIKGTVESVVYRNDENSYTVLVVKCGKEKITVVGTLPDAAIGETAIVDGDWIEHQDYGKQFKAASCTLEAPDTTKGMEKFLAGGYVRGVGPATAKLIIKKFGKEAFDILENQPLRLQELPGIGPKKARQIVDSYNQRREMRQAMVFMQHYGFSTQMAMRVYKAYGQNTIEVLKSDPYRLVVDIDGIGFSTADTIARNMGIALDNPSRLKAGILYVLNEATASGGHCYLPYDLLLNESSRILQTDDETADGIIRQLLMQGILINKNVDEVSAVYLPKIYSAECEVAQRLALLSESTISAPGGIEKRIGRYEKDSGVSLSVEQKEAVAAAANSGLTVLTGGPGTGKTTCIRCIIEVLSAVGRIVLCAPTGRAAKRMTETSGCEAKTIHRLLEYSGDEEGFQRNEDNPIRADVIIVDEVSMCDLFLMRNLLRAVKKGTRVIFVGDCDQLPPVGAGNVLEDLIECGIAKVIRLKRIYRQGMDSRIVENAHRINSGHMPMCNEKGTDFFFERHDTAEDTANAVIQLVSTRLPKFLKVDPFVSIQTMAPMKKGDVGVYNLNKKLQEALNPCTNGNEIVHGGTSFRKGDRVIQIRNNYDKEWYLNGENGNGVFNGDIGFVIAVDSEAYELKVRFEDDRIAGYDESDLDDLELAYCMSVHKSQGGEFDAVVIPLVTGPQMLLTRNLLYTAVTRAKRLVILVGRENCIAAMVRNDRMIKRYSGLKSKLIQLNLLSNGSITEEELP